MIQVQHKNLKKLRFKLYNKQNGICPLLKLKIPFKDAVVDHKHKTANELIGVKGAGLIRGVIHKSANALEGKILNNFKRLGLPKYIDLPAFLRNLADYLEQEPLPLIHPNEKPKPKHLKKISYNKLRKAYTGTAKFPDYPKSKKLTMPLKRLFSEYNILPEFYKGA